MCSAGQFANAQSKAYAVGICVASGYRRLDLPKRTELCNWPDLGTCGGKKHVTFWSIALPVKNIPAPVQLAINVSELTLISIASLRA